MTERKTRSRCRSGRKSCEQRRRQQKAEQCRRRIPDLESFELRRLHERDQMRCPDLREGRATRADRHVSQKSLRRYREEQSDFTAASVLGGFTARLLRDCPFTQGCNCCDIWCRRVSSCHDICDQFSNAVLFACLTSSAIEQQI